MNIDDLLRVNSATREFLDKRVPDELLGEILELARFAPSGGNRQPWRVIVLADPTLRAKVRDLYVLGWREYMAQVLRGDVAFSPGEDGVWREPDIDLVEAAATEYPFPFADNLDKVPALLVILAEMPSLCVPDAGRGRLSIQGGASVYPFVQNLLLVARSRGLGGTITTVLARREPELKELFGYPDSFGLAALVALGYPAKAVSKLTRKPVGEFCWVDRFEGQALQIATKE